MVCHVEVCITLPDLHQNTSEQVVVYFVATLLHLVETLIEQSSSKATEDSLPSVLFHNTKYVKFERCKIYLGHLWVIPYS